MRAEIALSIAFVLLITGVGALIHIYAVGYMAEGVRTGVLKPTDHPRERAVVLVLWQLGALVLHKHCQRLLGVDLTASPEDIEAWTAWVVPAMEILSEGVLEQAYYEKWRDAAQTMQAAEERKTRTQP